MAEIGNILNNVDFDPESLTGLDDEIVLDAVVFVKVLDREGHGGFTWRTMYSKNRNQMELVGLLDLEHARMRDVMMGYFIGDPDSDWDDE